MFLFTPFSYIYQNASSKMIFDVLSTNLISQRYQKIARHVNNKHFRYTYSSISDIDYVFWLHDEKLQQRLINEGRFAGKQVLDDPKT